MEKEISKSISLILPYIYALKQLRLQYSAYRYFIFIVELFTILVYPLNHSAMIADGMLSSLIQTYKTNVSASSPVFSTITSLFLVLVLLVLLALLSAYIQTQLKSSSKFQSYLEKLKKFFLIAFTVLQITILPAFILSAQNLVNPISQQFKVVSIITFPFALAFILVDKERRLYKAYSVIVLLSKILMPFNWSALVMAALSVKLGLGERRELHKKIVYFQFAVWMAFVLIVTILNQVLDSFYLLLALATIAGFIALNPQPKVFLHTVEENEELIGLTEKLMDNKDLSLSQKQLINLSIFNFEQELLSAEKHHLTQRELSWLSNFKLDLQKDQMLEFLLTKIDFQLRKEYSHRLKILCLECEIKFSKFDMKTLYEIEKLIQDVKIESTYEQKQKIFELVNLTDNKFLKKEQNINASTIISIEKATEQLYEIFINIAIIMQQFWTLHKDNRLNDQNICHILQKVVSMEDEAEELLKKISRYNNVRHELIIYEYLKKLINNIYKSKELSEYEMNKEDISSSENLNYILIERGNILAMSNRLLNEFELSKKEAQGYRINDIVNDPIAEYLSIRLDKLIEDEIHHQEVNFILPLKVSRDHAYIQPYRATVEILPELINGIKYIIHLQKTVDLQKTPIFLYSGKTDNIIGITKNFKKYFKIQHDQYLFQNYTNQLFNIDLLSMIQNQGKQFDEIICEFKAKRMNTKVQKKSQVTHIPVVIKKVKHYQIKDQNLILLSIVKREELEKTELTNFISEKLTFMLNSKGASKDKEKEEANEKNFCKISNPYENLIDEKMSKMSEFYRMSYLKGILVFITLLLLSLLASLIVLTIQLSNISSTRMDNYNNNIILNDKSVTTLQLYSQSSILYQLYQYPDQYLSINPQYNISALIKDYVSRVNRGIKIILSQDISNQIYSFTQQISVVSIYDIIQAAKEAIVKKDIGPLIGTWPFIQDTVSKEAVTDQNSLSDISIFFQYFSNFTIVVIVILLISAEVISYKIQGIFYEILFLYEKIDTAHSDQFVMKYRHFAHELYSSSYFRGVKSNGYLQYFKSKNAYEGIEEISTLCYLEDNVGFDIQQGQNLSGDGSKLNIRRKFILSFLSQEIYIFLILVFFTIFLQIFLHYILQYQSDFQQILDHSILLHEARGNISFGASFFMVSSLQQILPPNQRLTPIPPTAMYLSTNMQSQLPDVFNNYVSNESQLLNSNLCSLNLTNQVLYNNIICSQILEGIMTIGYSQTIVMYNQMVNQYAFNNNMSKMGSLYRPGAKYPVYIQILYIRRAIYNLMTTLEKSFLQQTQNYIQIENDTLSSIIKFGWILFPIFACITAIFYFNQKFKCFICLKSFFILPKQYLLQMKVTKILRQRDILNQIEKLAF